MSSPATSTARGTRSVTLFDDPGGLNYTWFELHLLDRPWNRGRVVLIGDAAHTCPPTIAQGAALSLEDALVLAELLTTSERVDDGLWNTFMDRRHDRVKTVIDASMQLVQWNLEHVQGDVPGVTRQCRRHRRPTRLKLGLHHPQRERNSPCFNSSRTCPTWRSASPDVPASVAFYERQFGLRVVDRDDDGTTYLRCWGDYYKLQPDRLARRAPGRGQHGLAHRERGRRSPRRPAASRPRA